MKKLKKTTVVLFLSPNKTVGFEVGATLVLNGIKTKEKVTAIETQDNDVKIYFSSGETYLYHNIPYQVVLK